MKYEYKISNNRNKWFDGVTAIVFRIKHEIRRLVQALKLNVVWL